MDDPRNEARPALRRRGLSDIAVRSAKPRSKPYKMFDGGGLYLLVQPNGAKLWRMKYRHASKERLLSFGAYHLARSSGVDVSLAEARRRRDEARQILRDQQDPQEHRRKREREEQKRTQSSFAVVAEEWIRKNTSAWSETHLARVSRFLRTELVPRFGSRPIDSITAPELFKILEAIEERGAIETAKKTRQYASAVFDYAQQTRGTIGNPAHALRRALTRRPATRYAFLSEHELGPFMVALNAYGSRRTALALKLQLLTAARPGEVRFARWREFDLKRQTWRIPAERMKTRQEHVVPLSVAVIELLKELADLGNTRPEALLFPSLVSDEQPISENTLNQAIRKLGFSSVSHGVRHCFSTLANTKQLGRPDAIEAALAHRQIGTRGTYNTSDYLDERRNLMELWADLLRKLEKASEGSATASPRTTSGSSTRVTNRQQ